MKTFVMIVIVLCVFNKLSAQTESNRLKLLISSRVDTSSTDVRSIIKLYEDYYNSRPDSIYNNPYWNQKEKELYNDFDFSRKSLFQGGLKPVDLFKYFSPFLMSVEPIGEKYQIRVLFSSTTTNPKYAGSKVWCIQKLNVIKENQIWVFENLMVELSKKWLSKKIGCIEYVYPPTHQFNDDNAEQSSDFCHQIIQRFNPDYEGDFRYYITSSIDDMGLLENFDYYFSGITTGKAREGMVLTAKGNEFYPHEFIHKLLPANKNRGIVIEEGLAEFLGTQENKFEYNKVMSKLARDLMHDSEKINFKSVISQSVEYNGYQTAYPAGAGICELVYKKCGDEGLIQLLKADSKNYNEIVNAVCSITHLKEPELEKEWCKIVKKYHQQK